MGTHAYLVMKKGNTARAIFVFWDGRDIGDTLRAMDDHEVAELWDVLGRVLSGEKSNHTYLNGLESDNTLDPGEKKYTFRDSTDKSVFEFPLDHVPTTDFDLYRPMRDAGLADLDVSVTWLLDVDNNRIYHYSADLEFAYPKGVGEDWGSYVQLRVMGAPRIPHDNGEVPYKQTWHFEGDTAKVIFEGDISECTARQIMWKDTHK